MSAEKKKLTLGFHGRIIDHLGIQMYQSPTAAIAEIVSNAWDADAEEVKINFDFSSSNKSDWTISIKDNGTGMSLDDCQKRYLSVGYTPKSRTDFWLKKLESNMIRDQLLKADLERLGWMPI
jgi:HSP90 family molecular chaperone